MQGKHALILYHWSMTWWPCVTSPAGRRLGYFGGGRTMWSCSVMSHTGDIPPRHPHLTWCTSDYFILRAFYELMVINGNDSTVFYWWNKENSQMRSRTKQVVKALQWGRRLPGLRGCGAVFFFSFFLLRIFPSLTPGPLPSPPCARHGCSGSNKSPAIAGADLLFISKCLKDKLWEGGGVEER